MPRTWGGFFRDNAFTIGGVVIGGTKGFADYYWTILTNVPLVENVSNPAIKGLFFAAQILAATSLYGGIGKAIDYGRAMYNNTQKNYYSLTTDVIGDEENQVTFGSK